LQHRDQQNQVLEYGFKEVDLLLDCIVYSFVAVGYHKTRRDGGINTVWTVDFETPVCKLYLLFLSANAAQEKRKKEKKVLLPTGVSKSAVHAV
jgi:hypothetical protein